MVGRRFTRLLVIARGGSDEQCVPTWLCRCDCGAEKVIRGGTLRSGMTKSCGCLKGGHELRARLMKYRSIDETSGCWNWTGAIHRNGYGKFGRRDGDRQRTDGAHRVAWEVLIGPIPDGLHVLHKCDNPCCINPEHLFVGTNQDNVDDMMAKGRHGSDR